MFVRQAVPPSRHQAFEVIVSDSDDEMSECEVVVSELMIGLTPMPTQDVADAGASPPGFEASANFTLMGERPATVSRMLF